ncbi:MAG TPA: glycosyltransferase family 2 protein [Tenuifilaceae bacterium]|nr:glycosyltransferase family 2 protein [Tenuifilaceae bacterium]
MSPLFYISLFLLSIVVIRFLIALLNYLTRPVLPSGKVEGNPLVSVLIPARNEEKNISEILNCLSKQDYSNIEVLVYNDQSTDATAQIVEDRAKHDERIRLIEGVELPEDWLGKNHACYQLAQRAKGNFYLFLDADVKVSQQFIRNATAYMQRKRLTLLSMFPRQEMVTWGERLVIPNMNWILLSLLFLRLVRWSKRQSLAAANGQMMMFSVANYDENQWHEKLKSSSVEDIGISRLVKRKKLRMATLLGTDDISCRMYNSYSESIAGFSKNVTEFFGGSVFTTILFTLISTFSPILIILSLPFPLTLLYFFSMVSSRMLISSLSEQSPYLNVILWPAQHLSFLHLVYKAIRFKNGEKLSWKGREINSI